MLVVNQPRMQLVALVKAVLDSTDAGPSVSAVPVNVGGACLLLP